MAGVAQVDEHDRDTGELTSRAASRPRRARTGFWLVAAAFLFAMAFSTVPTPLYPIYAHRDGLSSLVITIVFAVYAVGVVTSLLLVGHVSDWVGRRRVLLGAMAVEAVAGLMFIVSADLPMLIAARLVTGLGVGAVTATATAYVADLHNADPASSGTRRFEVVSGAANIGGLGFGPLVAGALAQFVGSPLRTSYVVFVVALLVSGTLVLVLAPETVVVPRAQWPRYRPQRPTFGKSKLAWAVSAGSGFSAFAVFGLFTSLAPEFVSATLHHPSLLLAGTVAFLTFGVAAGAQTLTAKAQPMTQFLFGIIGEASGLILLAVGMQIANLAVFLLAGAVSGAGAGVLFKSAVGRTVRTAAADRRGEALAGLFLVSYGGLIIPAVGVGVATQYFSATTSMLWFAAALVLVLASVALAGVRADRSTATS